MIKRPGAQVPAGAAEECSSPKLTFCANSCSVAVPPQWHIKGPDHAAKSAGGRLPLNMHTPLTKQEEGGLTMLSRHSVRICRKNNRHGN